MHFIAMLGFTIPGQTINYNMSPSEQEIREDIAMRERMEQLQQRAASGEQRPRHRSGGIQW
jgi:NO-binding membrane sensor protein with MHYT domain